MCSALLRRLRQSCAAAPRRLFTTHGARRYTEDHEWVQPLGTGRARIGITDYAQNALGDFVYVELPKVGAQVAKKDSIGVVESVKGASDIYAPVSGTITAVNEAAAAKPSLVNKSPEKDGWLCEMDLSEPKEVDLLYDEAGYVSFYKGTA